MALPIDTVQKVAGLARLQLTDTEIEMFSQQLGGILDYVVMLDELDTSGVEPMVHAIELTNVLRDDVLVPSLPRADGLKNAPKQDGHYFLVPAILEG